MRNRGADRPAVRPAPGRARAVVVLLISWTSAAAADHAPRLESSWRIEPRLYLSGITAHASKGGWSSTQHFVSTAGELKFWSDSRPWSAALFADYRHAFEDRNYDNLNLGGYLKHRHGDWDTTVFLFASKLRDARPAWIYAGRVRYRVAADHKLGLLVSGSLDRPASPVLGVGYFGTIRDSLWLNLIAGPGINHGPDVAAQLELVWRVR